MATLGAAVETAATLHQGISAVAASFYRERVNSGASRSFRQRATDFPTASTERKQPTDQEVERDRGIGSLELGDARLARPEARGEFDLRKPQLEPALGHGTTQRHAQVHERRFLLGETEKLFRVADLPAAGLESPGNDRRGAS